MQFHHHGYVSGDPASSPRPASASTGRDELPDEVDVLIVGGGPAGDDRRRAALPVPGGRRPGSSSAPRDGWRSVRRTASRRAASRRSRRSGSPAGSPRRPTAITEMRFWHPDPADPARIVRGERRPTTRAASASSRTSSSTRRACSTTSPSPWRTHRPAWGPTTATSCATWRSRDGGEHPSTSRWRRAAPSTARRCRARQVRARRRRCPQRVRESIGCSRGAHGDPRVGGHGRPRRHRLPGHPPKCAIQSGAGGSILLIPREGGHLFRMYVDLGEVDRRGTMAPCAARRSSRSSPAPTRSCTPTRST